MTKIAVVTGNPKRASRTHSVALAVAESLAKEFPGAETHPVVDLAVHAPRLFDWADEQLVELTAQVAAADIAVFASPTYKAAYTGMLKAFLDRYGSNGLAGVLVELGATLPTRGLYVTEPELADLDKPLATWSDSALPQIRNSLRN